MTSTPEQEPVEISPASFRTEAVPGEGKGAVALFPYDRGLVRRFRRAFPRARWREDHWFVPGVKAKARLDAWVAREIADLDRHADAKGRDEYAFEPLESRFLEVGDDLVVRTPYSRTVVAALRAVPWARWDPEAKAWRVPFRSYGELKRRWAEIEAAAARREAGLKDEKPPEAPGDKRRRAEKRKRRYPVPADDPPPADRPVATLFGVVVFEDTGGELADADAAEGFPFVGGDPDRFVWATWRQPTFREVRAVRPAEAPDAGAAARGWWVPTEAEVEARLDTLRRGFRRSSPLPAREG